MYVHVYEHDIELLILRFCKLYTVISVFRCKAISSFLELRLDRWISLVDILDFKKHTWIKFLKCVHLCNNYYTCSLESHLIYMLVTSVFCKEWVLRLFRVFCISCFPYFVFSLCPFLFRMLMYFFTFCTLFFFSHRM